MKIFPGVKPSYSPDGNYLLCIRGNEMIKYPVTASEIFRLVDEEKILGELNYNEGNWDPGL